MLCKVVVGSCSIYSLFVPAILLTRECMLIDCMEIPALYYVRFRSVRARIHTYTLKSAHTHTRAHTQAHACTYGEREREREKRSVGRYTVCVCVCARARARACLRVARAYKGTAHGVVLRR